MDGLKVSGESRMGLEWQQCFKLQLGNNIVGGVGIFNMRSLETEYTQKGDFLLFRPYVIR